MKKDVILQSHDRSKAYGIHTQQTFSSKILKEEGLEKVLQENRELIALSEPIINNLYNFVKGSGFFGILTDVQGCILNIMGDENVLEVAFELDMVPGAYMSEEHIGTNAMGTALWEKKPVQISGEEHFVKVYHRWTCSAAPIQDPKGNIIGTLNLTGYSNLVHAHTLGMVVAAVQSIELALKHQQAKDKLLWSRQYAGTIIDSIPKGILTLSPRGYIKSINRKGQKIIGASQDALIGVPAKEFFVDWPKVKSAFSHQRYPLKSRTYIQHHHKSLEIDLELHPIFDARENRNGMICIFTEVPRVSQLDQSKPHHKMYTFDKIIGRNKKFLNTLEYAKQIANSPSTVLISGESGTGKEVFAQSLHRASDRQDQPFIPLNCGAIPKDLIESELFGYEEGAFTGAKKGGNKGKFELAHRGSLFLDEIGEMPLFMQTNLLRVLEDREFYRIGGSKKIPVDVRIIAATNKDLREEVEKGNFRKDLYYRINVLPLSLAPLRERKDDIPLFIDYFMTTKSLKLQKEPFTLSKDQLEEMLHYHWPGNIRELENMVEQLVNAQSTAPYAQENSGISPGFEVAKEEPSSAANPSPPVKPLEIVEKDHILQALNYFNHNITAAAKALGLGRNTLYRKMDKYGISR
ncbi:sigma-54-dependent Fis family transcriptional regulator [Isachenkonia alkalipeptolytica]|uniref:GAF domain-containing protein n=1 Tax=Isachenkonia alkalipeptolytica TaxID=2565777 RepID=A0AA44BDD6_9CLOT|nr:sigma 54-interacting transcriptional regulator [Isachenkonia alkalipeptolytica]NBG87000.1 GAF domain-containing protein [Isachenkonia alkalipeptolytica]